VEGEGRVRRSDYILRILEVLVGPKLKNRRWFARGVQRASAGRSFVDCWPDWIEIRLQRLGGLLTAASSIGAEVSPIFCWFALRPAVCLEVGRDSQGIADCLIKLAVDAPRAWSAGMGLFHPSTQELLVEIDARIGALSMEATSSPGV